MNSPPTSERRPADDETPPDDRRNGPDEDTASAAHEPLDADDDRVRTLADGIGNPAEFTADVCLALSDPVPTGDADGFRTVAAVCRLRTRRRDAADAGRRALAQLAVPAPRPPTPDTDPAQPHAGSEGRERDGAS